MLSSILALQKASVVQSYQPAERHMVDASSLKLCVCQAGACSSAAPPRLSQYDLNRRSCVAPRPLGRALAFKSAGQPTCKAHSVYMTRTKRNFCTGSSDLRARDCVQAAAQCEAPAFLKEKASRLACKIVQVLAAFAIVSQPLPGIAGEIIEGLPRVSDGDTLQVVSCIFSVLHQLLAL